MNTLKKKIVFFKVALLQRRDTQDTQKKKLMPWSNLTFHLMEKPLEVARVGTCKLFQKKTFVYEALDEWGRFEEVLWWFKNV